MLALLVVGGGLPMNSENYFTATINPKQIFLFYKFRELKLTLGLFYDVGYVKLRILLV